MVRGAVIGFAAGLVASFAMAKAQRLVPNPGGGSGEPSTEEAGDALSRALCGTPLPGPEKADAGELIHYAFGTALGAAYGALRTEWSGIGTGFGTLFGAGVSLVVDEALVPLLGLGPSPTRTSPSTHVYGLASHLVFGAALESTYRILDEAL